MVAENHHGSLTETTCKDLISPFSDAKIFLRMELEKVPK
jgi:hypothetical protein